MADSKGHTTIGARGVAGAMDAVASPRRAVAAERAEGSGERPVVRETLFVANEQAGLTSDDLTATVGVTESVVDPTALFDPSAGPRYLPVRELGRGGMGRVDVVFDRWLGRSVAQKSALLGHRASFVVAEAQICAQLEHPSIVPIYDVDRTAEGAPSYTMRVVRGKSLRDVLLERDLPSGLSFAALLGVFRQVCLAVEYAHRRGVVHRDLKPENIVVGDLGEVYVLDWGVAKVLPTSDLALTLDDAVQLAIAGTPGFMPPEQTRGEPASPGTDVYALGAVLFEVVSGALPFDDEDPQRLAKAIAAGATPVPSDGSPYAPVAFDALVRACFDPSAAARPTARALADAVEAFLDGERDRLGRDKDAARFTADALRASAEVVEATALATQLEREGSALLAELEPWQSAEAKAPAWAKLDAAKRARTDSARALARAESGFSRALARVPDYRPARRGLADLYFREFERAERDGDAAHATQYEDLTRVYDDDGRLTPVLASEGVLRIVWPAGASASVQLRAFASSGNRRVLMEPRPAQDEATLPVGSYVAELVEGARVTRFPFVIRRAHRTTLVIRAPGPTLDEDICVVPGGEFLYAAPRRADRVVATCATFGLARFPVTLRQYARFLEDCDDELCRRVIPGANLSTPFLQRRDGAWAPTDSLIRPEARARLAPGAELDIPVFGVTWFAVAHYVRWLRRRSGLPYRLPTDLEWDKAMRGVDGRAYPMGEHLDFSFAKLRESRADPSQPEPVGAFPIDESPYGVRDLAGGVGDWTSTMVDGGPPPTEADELEPALSFRQAYWRGGNWGTAANAATALRYALPCDMRTNGVGFRLALDLPLGVAPDGDASVRVEPIGDR